MLGAPESLEGQALKWCEPAAIDPSDMTPADRPILQALRLPKSYVMTPADAAEDQRQAWFERMVEAIGSGARLLQLRLPHWSNESVRAFAADLLPMARSHGAQLLLYGDVAGARLLGTGVHLTREQFLSTSERPLPWSQLVGVNCCDDSELSVAARMSADFAVLSPFGMKGFKHGMAPLNWPNFQALVEKASLPVYALDRNGDLQLAETLWHAGQGVAGFPKAGPG